MKVLVLKVGVAMLMGVGAMLFSSPAAHASNPCPKQNCGDYGGLNNTGQCPLFLKCVTVYGRVWTSTYYACTNCKTTTPCPAVMRRVEVQEWTCSCDSGTSSGQTKTPVGDSPGPC